MDFLLQSLANFGNFIMPRLSWIIPPVLGGVIGYVTNALAIKMLFRPFKAYHLGPIPVPFTPGIIPRQRAALARNLGKMVSRELINPETLEKHFQKPESRDKLKHQFQVVLTEWGHKPLQEWFPETSFPKAILKNRKLMRSLIKPLVEKLFSLRAEDLVKTLAGDQGEWLPRLQAFLLEPNNRNSLVKALKQALGGLAGSAQHNNPVHSPESPEQLRTLISWVYEPMTQALLAWARKTENRKFLETRGRLLLKQVLEEMNSIQKLLVMTVQYDRTLDENMPLIVRDVINHSEVLFREKRQELIASFSQEWSVKIQGLADDKESELDLFLDSLLCRVCQPEIEWGFLAVLGESTMKDLLSFFSQRMGYERLSNRTVQFALHWLASERGQILLEKFGQTRLSDILPLENRTLEKVAEKLSDSGLAFLESRLPQWLAGFDVEKLVEDRVNSLEMDRVEALLLTVIKTHLKWINIFGAFLGALIGLSQLALRFLP